MPKALERKLRRQAHRLEARGVAVDEGAYVYGTLNKIKKAQARSTPRRGPRGSH